MVVNSVDIDSGNIFRVNDISAKYTTWSFHLHNILNMAVLKALWALFTKIGLAIGNVMSLIILTIFYFTIFAVFAIVYRMLAKNPFAVRAENSNWVLKNKNITSLDDLRLE